MAYTYQICYFCALLWCNSKKCEAPNPDCQQACRELVDAWNITYTFCGTCRKSAMKAFEAQFARKLLNPPRLRTEISHDDDEAQADKPKRFDDDEGRQM